MRPSRASLHKADHRPASCEGVQRRPSEGASGLHSVTSPWHSQAGVGHGASPSAFVMSTGPRIGMSQLTRARELMRGCGVLSLVYGVNLRPKAS